MVVTPYGLYADGPEQFTRPIVVDSSLGHGLIHFEDIFKTDIALWDYERRCQALGILLALAFGRGADDHANNNLDILIRAVISYKPSDIAMDVQTVHLGAKKADVYFEISSQESNERFRFISRSLKMFEHDKREEPLAWALSFFVGMILPRLEVAT
jgi:hypothetical protein